MSFEEANTIWISYVVHGKHTRVVHVYKYVCIIFQVLIKVFVGSNYHWFGYYMFLAYFLVDYFEIEKFFNFVQALKKTSNLM